jgi:hypothetical protein
MDTLFHRITTTIPSLFRGIFLERNFDGNPTSCYTWPVIPDMYEWRLLEWRVYDITWIFFIEKIHITCYCLNWIKSSNRNRTVHKACHLWNVWLSPTTASVIRKFVFFRMHQKIILSVSRFHTGWGKSTWLNFVAVSKLMFFSKKLLNICASFHLHVRLH